MTDRSRPLRRAERLLDADRMAASDRMVGVKVSARWSEALAQGSQRRR